MKVKSTRPTIICTSIKNSAENLSTKIEESFSANGWLWWKTTSICCKLCNCNLGTKSWFLCRADRVCGGCPVLSYKMFYMMYKIQTRYSGCSTPCCYFAFFKFVSELSLWLIAETFSAMPYFLLTFLKMTLTLCHLSFWTMSSFLLTIFSCAFAQHFLRLKLCKFNILPVVSFFMTFGYSSGGQLDNSLWDLGTPITSETPIETHT